MCSESCIVLNSAWATTVQVLAVFGRHYRPPPPQARNSDAMRLSFDTTGTCQSFVMYAKPCCDCCISPRFQGAPHEAVRCPNLLLVFQAPHHLFDLGSPSQTMDRAAALHVFLLTSLAPGAPTTPTSNLHRSRDPTSDLAAGLPLVGTAAGRTPGEACRLSVDMAPLSETEAASDDGGMDTASDGGASLTLAGKEGGGGGGGKIPPSPSPAYMRAKASRAANAASVTGCPGSHMFRPLLQLVQPPELLGSGKRGQPGGLPWRLQTLQQTACVTFQSACHHANALLCNSLPC